MTEPLPKWPGDCFTRAGLEMLRNHTNPDIRLVHATVPDSYNPGNWVEHGWCEMPATFTWSDENGTEFETTDTVVVDTAQPYENARILPRDIYYERCTPSNVRCYTFWQMVERARRHGHDGPWPD